MSLLARILRAAHCRSTHHYFAIDALQCVQTDKGRALADLLLTHYAGYLLGAKDPDTRFRDFQNHVVHVSDRHWGGAPKKAAHWADEAIECLDEECWEDAAYSIGVLSHYFTDPLMPLHTASSDAETVVHRPMEWSVCKSYEAIYSRWRDSQYQTVFPLTNKSSMLSGSDWVRDAVIQAAELSHPHYERLIEIYDLPAGVKSPPDGLNDESREILTDLFGFAITGTAQIIDRLANQTTAAIPPTSIALGTVIAAIQMPAAWVLKKIDSAKEKLAVAALFNEYQRTGTLTRHLPAEIKTVRSERAADTPAVSTKSETPQPATPSSGAAKITSVETKRIPQVPSLSESDDLVDAPSIGPKTAKRFEAIGIHTVGEFLSASPDEMVVKLATSWIDQQKLIDWQHQARLVTQVASLCGYKSQLLVAVGCTNASQLAEQDASSLTAQIKQFAGTSAGKRILRNTSAPPESEIRKWIEDASSTPVRKVA
ncbi:DUF4332 domain-containing protein [Stieleria varia]|uniref:Pathogenicity locus n=1 Tax=Stieleria varia TaxID=2528005 RepID=A0A5C6AMR6_9BACT|nr:DUF4332 domain-containing protein [Stieleria varia]TWU00950.1 Pathogenicity locus [Stieleria varia]